MSLKRVRVAAVIAGILLMITMPRLTAQQPCQVALPTDSLSIPHMSSGIELNTDPHSKVWAKTASAWISKDCTRSLGYPDLKTEVKGFWTDRHLYLLFICPYRTLNLFLPAQGNRDRDKLWDKDVVEMFLGDDWQKIRHYREFEIAPTGDWVDLAIDLDGDAAATLGLVRGVTPAVLLVRRKVQIVEGRWPGPGEVLVGRLAAAKLGRSAESLAVGQAVTFEGRSWRVSGHFAAVGSALESELWCPLEDLQQAMKRQDLSVVALTLAPGVPFGAVDEFCKERIDLELQATPETAYYEALHKHYAEQGRASWVNENFITDDTEALSAAAEDASM